MDVTRDARFVNPLRAAQLLGLTVEQLEVLLVDEDGDYTLPPFEMVDGEPYWEFASLGSFAFGASPEGARLLALAKAAFPVGLMASAQSAGNEVGRRRP